MLPGPHLAVGALIGRRSPWAWLGPAVAFASHYALDALPHSYLSLREEGALPLKGAIITVDAVVGLALVFWIARRQVRWRLILGSALAATALDLVNPVTSVGEWLGRVPGIAGLISTHMNWAWHVPFGGQWLFAFGPSLAVLVLGAVAASRLRPSAGSGRP